MPNALFVCYILFSFFGMCMLLWALTSKLMRSHKISYANSFFFCWKIIKQNYSRILMSKMMQRMASVFNNAVLDSELRLNNSIRENPLNMHAMWLTVPSKSLNTFRICYLLLCAFGPWATYDVLMIREYFCVGSKSNNFTIFICCGYLFFSWFSYQENCLWFSTLI